MKKAIVGLFVLTFVLFGCGGGGSGSGGGGDCKSNKTQVKYSISPDLMLLTYWNESGISEDWDDDDLIGLWIYWDCATWDESVTVFGIPTDEVHQYVLHFRHDYNGVWDLRDASYYPSECDCD